MTNCEHAARVFGQTGDRLRSAILFERRCGVAAIFSDALFRVCEYRPMRQKSWLHDMPKTQKRKKADNKIVIPPAHDWRTTDADEINRRRLRARNERFAISNAAGSEPVHSRFRVKSGTGMTYSVEIRNVTDRQFACDCTDFLANNLGTCKHVEAVLLQLEARLKGAFKTAVNRGPQRLFLVPDRTRGGLRLDGDIKLTPRWARRWIDAQGALLPEHSPEEFLTWLSAQTAKDGTSAIQVSQEVAPWLEARQRAEESVTMRREYEQKVHRGEWPPHETLSPLFPYQREGMLHLAFTERALLADEMGLGKTIQAIAACALLHRLGKARRVLVVTPASLKSEWEEQIQRFTTLDYQLVFGARAGRLDHYRESARPNQGLASVRTGEWRGRGRSVPWGCGRKKGNSC